MKVKKISSYLGSVKIEVTLMKEIYFKEILGVMLPREIISLKPEETVEIPEEFILSNMNLFDYNLPPEKLSDKTFLKLVCDFYHYDGKGALAKILKEESHCM